MKATIGGLLLLGAIALSSPGGAAAQMVEQQQPILRSPPSAGASLTAAATNILYFPARFVVTLITAEVGGVTGWMTGGDEAAASAVWSSTDGQVFVTPEVIEGREPLRLGRWRMGGEALPPAEGRGY